MKILNITMRRWHLIWYRLTQDTYQTVFSSYLISSTEDYYVFINSYSKNVNDWNEDGIANEKAALEFIHWLISDRTTDIFK